MNIILQVIILSFMTFFNSSFSSEAGRQTTTLSEQQPDSQLPAIFAMRDHWTCKKLCDDPDNTEQSKKCKKDCLVAQKLTAKHLISLMGKTRNQELLSLLKEFKLEHNINSSTDELYKIKELEQ